MADNRPPDYIGALVGLVTVAYIADVWSHGAITDAIRRFLARPAVVIPTVRDTPDAGFLRDLYDSTREGGLTE